MEMNGKTRNLDSCLLLVPQDPHESPFNYLF